MDISTLSIETDAVTHKRIINNEYRIERKIGEGQYGKVLLAEVIEKSEKSEKSSKSDSKTNSKSESISKGSRNANSTASSANSTVFGGYVAIKTINRVERNKLITKTYLSHTHKIKHEIAIMKSCDHPNVVKLYKVIDDLKFDKILLVLEYCQLGEIDWKSYNHYNEKHYKHGEGLTINRILRDVVNGLDYLHRIKNIIHRDLKPLNLLIAADRTIKISDFGVSLILENNANDERELGKSMGTPAFFAPELCQFVNNRFSMLSDMRQRKIDNKIDLWSLGVVLFCLVFHLLPFNGHNEFVLFKNIVNHELKFPKIRHLALATKDDMAEISLLRDLIGRLLTKDPHDRIAIDGIKNHRFTTWDLDAADKLKFRDHNRKYEPSIGALGKIRKFFGNDVQPAPSSASAIAAAAKPATAINPSTLEQVDDLLDSYFDDSSSLGSLEEVDDSEDEVTRFDSDILKSVSTNSLSAKLKPNLSPIYIQRSQNNTASSLNLRGANGTNTTSASTPTLSTPLDLPVVTIGAGSPTIFKSMFSPSRRFFSKIKKQQSSAEPEPTINSLSSPTLNDNSDYHQTFTDFRPPNVLASSSSIGIKGNNSQTITSGTGGNTSGLSSRKNSVSSTSNTLSRIPSSSSSLNLNGYLTDDNYSLHSPRNSGNSYSHSLKYKIDKQYLRSDSDSEVELESLSESISYHSQHGYHNHHLRNNTTGLDIGHDSSNDEEGDETFTMDTQTQSPSTFKHVLNMNEYLDGLQ